LLSAASAMVSADQGDAHGDHEEFCDHVAMVALSVLGERSSDRASCPNPDRLLGKGLFQTVS
jgi:hypothetical protein